MTWSKPDFVEITLNMEVTGYVNTDEEKESTQRQQVNSSLAGATCSEIRRPVAEVARLRA